jgi:UDP-N-acetylmuramyl pentapeptide phosphotransferase/UDP-N-acetylglucosamine-1-phosphate transferase
LVGLGEDVRGIPVAPRFALLLLGCLPLGLLVGAASMSAAVLAVLAVLFGVAVVNAVNFMDGINGISAAQGVVGGVAFAAFAAARDLDELALVAAATAGAALSFAPFNVPRARVFLGDTGSYGLGAVLAGAAVLLLSDGLPVEAALAPLALYLADTGTTLLRRVLGGETWHLPHRTHVYQRLTDQGFSHTQVSALVLGLLALCAGLGALSLVGGSVRTAGDAALLLVVLTYLALPRLVDGVRAPA